MNKPSLVSARYILTFIDDLSRFTWVYFLNNKNILFEKFKEFRALAKKQCRQPNKCFRLENGGRYVSQQFEAYLSQYGNSLQISIPHTHQQNCVAKMKNHTLVEMDHYLLQAIDLPTKFCVEVVYCSNYLLNLVPTRAISSMNPIEKWFQEKKLVSYLKTFRFVS